MQSRFPRIHHKYKSLDHRPIHSLSLSLSKYSFTHSSMLSINNVPRGSLIIIDRLTGCRAPAYLQINSDRTLDDLQTTSNYPLSSCHHRGGVFRVHASHSGRRASLQREHLGCRCDAVRDGKKPTAHGGHMHPPPANFFSISPASSTAFARIRSRLLSCPVHFASLFCFYLRCACHPPVCSASSFFLQTSSWLPNQFYSGVCWYQFNAHIILSRVELSRFAL